MDFKQQLMQIVGLVYEINETTDLHVNIDYIGFYSALKIFIYKKEDMFSAGPIKFLRVTPSKPVLIDEVTGEAAIEYFNQLLLESGAIV